MTMERNDKKSQIWQKIKGKKMNHKMNLESKVGVAIIVLSVTDVLIILYTGIVDMSTQTTCSIL